MQVETGTNLNLGGFRFASLLSKQCQIHPLASLRDLVTVFHHMPPLHVQDLHYSAHYKPTKDTREQFSHAGQQKRQPQPKGKVQSFVVVVVVTLKSHDFFE